MKKEATLSYAIFYIFLFMIVVFIFLVGTPFLMQMNESMSDAGRTIFDQGLIYANNIDNTTVKTTMVNIFTDNKDTITTYEPTINFWFQYAWMFVLIIISFVVIVVARRAEVMKEQMGVI
jgi:hypothetical protein